MTGLDFEGTQEQELDFEGTQKKGDLSYPSGPASEVAAMGSYVNETDLEYDYEMIKNDLMLTGYSDMIEGIKQRDLEERKEALTTAIKDILIDPSLDDTARAESLQAATELAREDAARPVWKIFQDTLVFNYSDNDPEYAAQQKGRWSEIQEIQSVQSIIDELKIGIINNKDGSFEGSLIDGMGDLAEITVPFVYATTVNKLYTHMTGEVYGTIIGKIVPGEVMHKLKEEFAFIPTAEGKVEWARKMVGFLKDNPGLIKDNNGLESFFLVNTLLDTTFVPGEDFDIDRLVDNVVGILDISLIGGAIARGIKNPLSVIGIMSRTNPELAGRIQSAMIKSSESDEALKALGITREQAIRASQFLGTNPKFLTGAPSDIVAGIKEIDDELAGIVESYLTKNPTQARRLKEIAEEYGAGKIKINDTTIVHLSDTEKELTVTVGRTRNSGYTTVDGAKAAAKLRGLDDETLTVLKKNPKTGKIGEIKEGTTLEKGEYFYQFKRTEQVPADTPFVDFFDIRTLGGAKTRNFYDIFSMFKKADALKLSGIEDLKHGVMYQIQQAGRNFDKLDVAGKEKVLGYLNKGSKEKRTYTYDELISGSDVELRLKPDEYVAYSNMRSISDLVYHTENSRLTDWLKNNNYRHLVGTDKVQRYGIKTDDTLDGITEVLSLRTSEPEAVTKAMQEALKTGKAELYKLRSKEGRGTTRYEYVYVPKTHFSKVKDIPNQSLPYLDGYVYRKYTDNFFIERVDPRVTVNGASKASKGDQTSVIGSAEKQSDAINLMGRLRSETLTAEEIEAGVTLNIRMGRDLIRDMGEGEAIFQFAGMNGLLHKGTRGPLLNSIEGANGSLLPVVDSIQSSMNRAAANLSIRPMVEKLEKDFVAAFGGVDGFIPLSPGGGWKFPLDRKRFDPIKLPQDKKVHDQMLAAWEYINFLGRFEDPVTKGYRATLLNFANWIDTKGWSNSFLTKTLEVASKSDPLDVLKGATFTGFLALNPVRQLFVQMSQHSMLAALDPRYIASGRMYKDTATLMYGAAIRTNKKLWSGQAEGLARARGISVKDYTKEVDEWMKSGLPSGIDSHNFLGGILLNSTELAGHTNMGKNLARIGNVLKAPVRFSRKVGFNAGEATNLAMSWHVARRRLDKIGKKYTPEDVTNEARALAFGMNRAGEFTYQRGYLKLTTQFFSMQHKAMLIVMNAGSRGKFGNRFFSKEEAFRMAGLQALIFGAEGLGIYSVASWVLDQYEEATGEPMNSDMRETVINGLGTLVINKIITEASDNLDSTHLNFSSFAVLSGSTLLGETVLDMLFKSNEAGIETFMGASGAYITRVIDSLKLAYEVLQFPEGDNSDKILAAMKAIGMGLSSGINNYYKGMIAAQEGFFRDRHGNGTVRATAAEAWGKVLFGLDITDSSEYYRLKMNRGDLNRARKQQARLTARAIESIYRSNKHLDDNLLSEKLQAVTSYINLLPLEEREILRPLLFEALLAQAQASPGSDNLIGRILQDSSYDFVKWSSGLKRAGLTDEQSKAIGEIADILNANPEGTEGFVHSDEEEDQ